MPSHTGKGKGYGRPPKSTASKPKLKPRTKVQQEATDLLSTTWTTLPEDIQDKLQASGIGPKKPVKDLLKTHLADLPQPVQEVVTRLTAPEPVTERDIAAQLKSQVTELKQLSARKTQLQTILDQIKAQYATLLQDMQELQNKRTQGQQKLKTLSEDYMKAVNQSPPPTGLTTETPGEMEQIPMAVESFVHSLGISLSDEQKSQLHGFLKRPNPDLEDPTTRRKTESGPIPPSGGQCG